MLAYLLYYQFAFLYLLAMIIGLVVFGSDFKGIAGWIYIVPLILLTVIHKRIWSHRYQISSGIGIWLICAIGAVVAVLVYQPMHMGYWDEHSLSQAFLIAVLGVCSYLLSVVAAAHLDDHLAANKNESVLALVIIGLLWSLATQYPLAVLFCLAILFVIAAFWLHPLQAAPRVKAEMRPRSDPFAKFAILLIAIDISCVVWDFEIDTQWAWYIAMSFLAAAAGYFVAGSGKRSDQWDQAIYLVVIANFLTAAVLPAYILWFLHVGIAGFCLGYLLPAAIFRPHHTLQPTMGWTVWFFLGVVLSNAWYANLLWASTRVVLLLPFAIIALLSLRYRYSALKHQG